MKFCPPLLRLLFIGFAAVQGHAAVILSNLPGNDAYGIGLAQGDSVGEEFQMTGDYVLTLARFRAVFENGSPLDTVALTLRANATGSPGTTLTTFTSPTFGAGFNIKTYDFTPDTTFTLTSGTTYWLVLTFTGDPSDHMDVFGNTPQIVPTGPGATWIKSTYGSGGLPTQTDPDHSVEVQGTLAPEPSCAALGLCGLAMAMTRRKR